MDRRRAIKKLGLLAGASLSVPTVSGLLAGCGAPAEPYSPRALAPDAYSLVADLAETIIPGTDTPGAMTAGVHRFIDAMLADYYPEAEAEALRTALMDVFRAVAGPDGRPAVSAVERLDEASYAADSVHHHSDGSFTRQGAYRRFKELVVVGFYTSEEGAMRELRLMPMGPYEGDMTISDGESAWAVR